MNTRCAALHREPSVTAAGVGRHGSIPRLIFAEPVAERDFGCGVVHPAAAHPPLMLRQTFLWLSNRHGIFRFIRNNRLARRFAQRFVAGETLDTAIAAVKALNTRGISASLDLLGESVTNASEAASTAQQYVDMLDRIAAEQLNCNVSVKLTALGQDISDEVCLSNIVRVLERAKAHGTFVRLDMESSAYTERTLAMFREHLFPRFPNEVGIVLQSYLRRTATDVDQAVALQCRVRLCKGAYKEPATVALPDKADVDANYVSCMKRLVSDGRYPGLATHDEAIIAEARSFTREKGIPADRYEFQMLYGVRRDLQDALVRAGYRMRVYVPFGTQWYPYLMRRLAERPANVAFMAGNIVRERLHRRR
jgi:proline dehydrogenase